MAKDKHGKHKEWCKNYKASGQREVNKVKKQGRHEKQLEYFAKRREEGKTYTYQKNPYEKDSRAWLTERAKRAEKEHRDPNEYRHYAKMFGRLQRDLDREYAEARKEEMKTKKRNKKIDASDN